MLNQAQLLEQINATIGKTKILKLTAILQVRNFDLQHLIELTFQDNKNIAFRAAWLLENILLKTPTVYVSYFNLIINNFENITHASCKRHYAKIAAYLTSPKASAVVRNELLNISLEPVINQCFEWLIDPKVLVAVKSFAAETLFNLRHRYPWVSEELSAQLIYLMRNGSPAIQNKGEKLLGYLQPL